MSLLKRLVLIGGLILLVVLIGLGLYGLFKKTAPGYKPTAEKTGEASKLPAAGERITPTSTATAPGQLPTGQPVPTGPIPQAKPSFFQPQPVSRLTSDFTVYPSLSRGGTYRFHNASDGKFYRVMPDGAIKELADQVFYNVSKVTWASNKDTAVIEYPDSSKIVYNFETKKQVTLPKHWEEFSFSPEGTRVAAKSMGLSPENRWLVTFNDDGTGTTLIEPMGKNADKVKVDWSPSKQVVAFAQTGRALGSDRREVLLVGLNGENFKSLTVEGLGFKPQWSPTGQKLLYSVYSARSDYKPELWITNSYGDAIDTGRQTLKLNTWADKCAFGNDDTLFCAVPDNIPQGAGMIPELANGLTDSLYKIDLKTGLKTNIPLGGNYSVSNITFDSNQNKIFFTDVAQNGIFEAKL